MEKTKIGLSVKYASVLVFLLFLFGGYTVGLLAFGYVMLCEKDQTLRVSAVTALLILIVCSLIQLVIGLLPDIVDIFTSLLNIFRVYVSVNILHSIANFFYNILALFRTVIYVILALMALLNKPVQLSFIKKLVD